MPIKDRETLRTLSKSINFIFSFLFFLEFQNCNRLSTRRESIDFPEEYLELREINFDTWLHIF